MSDLHALHKQLEDQKKMLEVTIESVGASGANRHMINMAHSHLARAVILTERAAQDWHAGRKGDPRHDAWSGSL